MRVTVPHDIMILVIFNIADGFSDTLMLPFLFGDGRQF